MTDVESSGVLAAREGRAEALLEMARRESDRPEMTLAEAEEWWAAERSRLGLDSSPWQRS